MPFENEEILALRQLLVMQEARLAEALAEIETLKKHIAAAPRQHTTVAEQNSNSICARLHDSLQRAEPNR